MPISVHPLFSGEPSRLVGLSRDEGLVARIRAEFGLVRLEGDRLAADFYDRLFALHPGVREMFRSDPADQRQKLMDSLDATMAFLDDPPRQRAYLEDLGRRHAEYGARPEHYAVVADLLARAVVGVLGPRAEEDTLGVWRDVFDLVSAQMLAGAGA